MKRKLKPILALLISCMLIFGILGSVPAFAAEADISTSQGQIINAPNEQEQIIGVPSIQTQENEASSRSGLIDYLLHLFTQKRAEVNLEFLVNAKNKVKVSFKNVGNATGIVTGKMYLYKYSPFTGKDEVVGQTSVNETIGAGILVSKTLFPFGSNKDFDYLDYDLTITIPGDTSSTNYHKQVSKGAMRYSTFA